MTQVEYLTKMIYDLSEDSTNEVNVMRNIKIIQTKFMINNLSLSNILLNEQFNSFRMLVHFKDKNEKMMNIGEILFNFKLLDGENAYKMTLHLYDKYTSSFKYYNDNEMMDTIDNIILLILKESCNIEDKTKKQCVKTLIQIFRNELVNHLGKKRYIRLCDFYEFELCKLENTQELKNCLEKMLIDVNFVKSLKYIMKTNYQDYFLTDKLIIYKKDKNSNLNEFINLKKKIESN